MWRQKKSYEEKKEDLEAGEKKRTMLNLYLSAGLRQRNRCSFGFLLCFSPGGVGVRRRQYFRTPKYQNTQGKLEGPPCSDHVGGIFDFEYRGRPLIALNTSMIALDVYWLSSHSLRLGRDQSYVELLLFVKVAILIRTCLGITSGVRFCLPNLT